MDTAGIAAWFEDYLDAFRAYAVGETRDPAAMLAFCDVPMRRRADGSELERLQVLYVVAARDGEPRMAALLRCA